MSKTSHIFLERSEKQEGRSQKSRLRVKTQDLWKQGKASGTGMESLIEEGSLEAETPSISPPVTDPQVEIVDPDDPDDPEALAYLVTHLRNLDVPIPDRALHHLEQILECVDVHVKHLRSWANQLELQASQKERKKIEKLRTSVSMIEAFVQYYLHHPS